MSVERMDFGLTFVARDGGLPEWGGWRDLHAATTARLFAERRVVNARAGRAAQ